VNDPGGVDGAKLGEVFKIFLFGELATKSYAEKLIHSSTVKHRRAECWEFMCY